MSKKQWENRILRDLKSKLQQSKRNHANLSVELTKHHSSSVIWQQLLNEYLAESENIITYEKKIKLYKDTGKVNGLDDGSRSLPFGTRL